MVITEYLEVATAGSTDVIDLTKKVGEKLNSVQLKNGIVVLSVIGSTAALTTCEFESGLVQDIKDIFESLIPVDQYCHDQAWGDGNGHSHLRASLIGPSLTIPFAEKELVLGTWQQIILIDFDNRPRQREIILQFIGE